MDADDHIWCYMRGENTGFDGPQVFSHLMPMKSIALMVLSWEKKGSL